MEQTRTYLIFWAEGSKGVFAGECMQRADPKVVSNMPALFCKSNATYIVII